MAIILTLNQSNIHFSVKLTDCGDGTIQNISDIVEQKISFINPDGVQFSKEASLTIDPENPSQTIPVSNLIGNGIDGTIIGTISNTNILKDGEIGSISNTTNFNVDNVPISIIDGTTFSYNLGTVGDIAPESTGTLITQGEFIITYINFAPEDPPLLNLIGTWHYFAKIKNLDEGISATSEAVIFYVNSHDASL